MDIKQNLDSLEDLLNGQIAKIVGKGNITPTELENMTKTLCLLEKIKDYKEDYAWEDEEGHSQMAMPRRYSRRSNSMGDMIRDPYSMNSYEDGSRRSYRRNRGYSGHSIKDRMIDKLESMYDEAKTDHERQIVDEWIDRLNTGN